MGIQVGGANGAGSPEGALLVRECEEFLDGRFALRLADAERPVPGWAWVNLLVHGSERLLRALAALAVAPWTEDADQDWGHVTVVLAQRLCRVAETFEVDLVRLQRCALVPIELEMFHDPGWQQVGPGIVAMRIMSAIDEALGNRCL
ncbi:MAG TPA: hypothetical protein VE991_01455 [Acidimicrobiales bacterium]|nr:hypothetical protein [Acidimicrobiales bacterium]